MGALMQAVLSAFALLVMFLSTFSEGSMQSLFGFLRSLQLTIHVITFKVNIHATLLLLYQGLVTIVMFDFLEMIETYSGAEIVLMKTTPLNAYSEEFSLVGYESVALFKNLGTLKFMLFYFVVLGGFLILSKILLKLMKSKSPVRKRVKGFQQSLNITQVIVSFMMQSFFDFCMMLFIFYRISPLKDSE